MHHRQRDTEPARESVEMQETRHVGGDEQLRASLSIVGQSIETHPRRDRRLVDAERSAEAAAFIGTVEVRERQTAHGAQHGTNPIVSRLLKLARRREPESPQRVTPNVHRRLRVSLGAERGEAVEADDVVEVGAILRRPCCDAGAVVTERSCVHANMQRAATRKDDDRIVTPEGANESFERGGALVLEPRIGRRLAAARRARGDFDVDAETLQHPERRDGRAGAELIHETGREERDRHRSGVRAGAVPDGFASRGRSGASIRMTRYVALTEPVFVSPCSSLELMKMTSPGRAMCRVSPWSTSTVPLFTTMSSSCA